MSITCSCKNCHKRKLGCHSVCEDYRIFKEALKKRNDTINKKKQQQVEIDSFFFTGPGKTTHLYGNRRTGPK